jgi:CheY-like chemotaxis protein
LLKLSVLLLQSALPENDSYSAAQEYVVQLSGNVSFFHSILPPGESMTEASTKPRVLVADDERVIADTLVMILNQSGFNARAVYSGEKAVEQALIFKPEMIVSDVIMAELNGIDTVIQIRKLFPKIKILLFSGQAATANLLEKARAQGYEFEILAKPVHPQDLLAKLRV